MTHANSRIDSNNGSSVCAIAVCGGAAASYHVAGHIEHVQEEQVMLRWATLLSLLRAVYTLPLPFWKDGCLHKSIGVHSTTLVFQCSRIFKEDQDSINQEISSCLDTGWAFSAERIRRLSRSEFARLRAIAPLL